MEYSADQCCGCSLCEVICPFHAISMEFNDHGALQPRVNEELCCNCGKCKDYCPYVNTDVNEKMQKRYGVFAAAAKNQELLMRSASGGFFGAFARNIIRMGGCVVGAAYIWENERIAVKHILVDNEMELYKIQGSKYIQSNLSGIFETVKNAAQSKVVLFSGTPCQVDAIKRYVGDVPNLLTIDIICHGVPGQKMFLDYVAYLETRYKVKIKDICFRDKKVGWGLDGTITYEGKGGKCGTSLFPRELSSYYMMFLKRNNYRSSCYTCKYSGPVRVSDITIGDYWGIDQEHPEYIGDNEGQFALRKGISCVLVNTEKGQCYLSLCSSEIEKLQSEFDKVAKHNLQLCVSSEQGKDHRTLFDFYVAQGYKGVERWYRQGSGLRYYIWRLRRAIKQMINT